MPSADHSSVDPKFLANAMASFLQIGAVLVLLYWCFQIMAPFLNLIVWAAIISVAAYPTYTGLADKMGRPKTAAAILVLIGLAIILVPAWMLTDSTLESIHYVSAELEDGTATIPPPNPDVADWPLIGERVYAVWSAGATNLESTLNQFQPQLQALSQQAIGFASHTVGTIFLFVFAVIIAGAFWGSAGRAKTGATNFATSLIGTERGPALTQLSLDTIRSVAKGVLGVAFIQAIFAAIGFMVAGVPAAGILSGVVLVLAIVQLPVLLITLPVIVWYYSVADPVAATVFAVYMVVVSASDMALKPMMLGRDVETPMLVILIGAIGGAITQGIVGLFIGAVVLALGYEILVAWMAPKEVLEEREQD